MKAVISFGLGIATVAATLAIAQPAGLPGSIDDYWSWTRLNINRFTDNTTGAHPQPKDVYINLDPINFLAADGTMIVPFPDGTIVIKERNDPEELLVDRLYMMEKIGEAWNYGFYDRRGDGTFVGQDFGTNNLCSDCHEAAVTDFVFTQFQRRI